MHRIRPAATTTVVLAALLLAGCSAPASSSRPSDAGDAGAVQPTTATATPTKAALDIAGLDACTLLTKDEAQTLIGTALADPLKAATSDVSNCTYPGAPDGPTAQVEVYAGPGAKKQLETDRDTLGHTFAQVPGLGDEAWQEDDAIFARKGDVWASVIIVSLDDAAPFAAPLQTAMTTVLGRL